ncbi:MAG: UPF0147 family protein [Thermoprotei archaeon]|mgnify:CR=1 FL=1|nr:UPF0147 family protein [Thermoprotei archaeon]
MATTYSNPEERAAQAIMILQRIAEDTGVPRNIRRAASEAIKMLQRKDLSPALRAANAISILDEVATDPNMPLFARTAIWQAVSILEQIRDQV